MTYRSPQMHSKNNSSPDGASMDFKEDCTDGSDEDHCGQCDFHEDMCGLVTVGSFSSYKWQRAQAEVFGLAKNSTAPDTDGQGNPQGYFVVLTGDKFLTKTSPTILRTPVLGETSQACRLQFFYHFNVKGGVLEVFISQRFGEKSKRFSQKTSTGKKWQFASVSIGNYPPGKMIEFQGDSGMVTYRNQVQDIAIDSINYINCDPTKVYTESLNCTFDLDECGWYPDNGVTNATWTRAKTLRGYKYGPKSDHTGRKGYFMFVLGAGVLKKGDKAHLVSLRQGPTNQRCFNFWYHMYGEDVGTLKIITRIDKDNTTIWSKTGSQGNSWKQGARTIRSTEPYQIVIESVIGSFPSPVIAIDDIEIYEDVCPHPDPCFSNPCKNDGVCTIINNTDYLCECKQPFSGNHCERHPCHSSPCLNDGTCIAVENNYGCVCDEPFYGRHCENGPCTPSPCKNAEIDTTQADTTISDRITTGSVTTNKTECYCGENSVSCRLDVRGNKLCFCKKGYDQRRGTDICSRTCQLNADCRNDGFCDRDGPGYFCLCPEPFIGDRCELDVCNSVRFECRSKGAECVSQGTVGVCKCPMGKKMSLYNYCEGLFHFLYCKIQ
ncbi:hypothetical protein JTE90_006431 [Oedothorax gibbosus]|uniref:Uncharacterized protein n=1 Tax=Oedothorax gibbosus TaxID=931172 RepID=A0AAV6TT29_9ARAC|nr:hypothetical protein JTE90_006431 [Oedothorax gibbosus]